MEAGESLQDMAASGLDLAYVQAAESLLQKDLRHGVAPVSLFVTLTEERDIRRDTAIFHLEIALLDMVVTDFSPAVKRLMKLAEQSGRISHKLAALAVIAKQIEDKRLPPGQKVIEG